MYLGTSSVQYSWALTCKAIGRIGQANPAAVTVQCREWNRGRCLVQMHKWRLLNLFPLSIQNPSYLPSSCQSLANPTPLQGRCHMYITFSLCLRLSLSLAIITTENHFVPLSLSLQRAHCVISRLSYSSQGRSIASVCCSATSQSQLKHKNLIVTLSFCIAKSNTSGWKGFPAAIYQETKWTVSEVWITVFL